MRGGGSSDGGWCLVGLIHPGSSWSDLRLRLFLVLGRWWFDGGGSLMTGPFM